MKQKERKSGKVMQLNTTLSKTLEYYFQFTRPINKLTNTEIKVLIAILVLYYKEYNNFVRPSDRWKNVFDYDSKLKLIDELGMDKQVFSNYLTFLRNKKVIIDNQVAPAYNPLSDPSCNVFELKFIFNIKPNDQ